MPTVQLGICVLDASGSMAEAVQDAPENTSKAWQVEEMLCLPLPIVDTRAVALEQCGVIARLQESERAGFTELGIIRFNTQAQAYGDPRMVKDWTLSPDGTKLKPPDPNVPDQPRYQLGEAPFNLLEGMGGGTNIAEGLKLAHTMAKQFIQRFEQPGSKNKPFVTIVLMSDMRHTEGDLRDPVEAARLITSNVHDHEHNRPQIVLAAAAFGDNADLDLMRDMATPGPQTDPAKYAIKTTKPHELRAFFLDSFSRPVG